MFSPAWAKAANDDHLSEAAEYLRLPLGLVQAAVAHYGAYTNEIDEVIAG